MDKIKEIFTNYLDQNSVKCVVSRQSKKRNFHLTTQLPHEGSHFGAYFKNLFLNPCWTSAFIIAKGEGASETKCFERCLPLTMMTLSPAQALAIFLFYFICSRCVHVSTLWLQSVAHWPKSKTYNIMRW